MNIIISKYSSASAVKELKPKYVYVLRIEPYTANTIVGIEISPGQYSFEITNFNLPYKLYEGLALGSVTENTDFGIVTPSMLTQQSGYVAVPPPEDKFVLGNLSCENINPAVQMPVELVISANYKINSNITDIANSPFNFNFIK